MPPQTMTHFDKMLVNFRFDPDKGVMQVIVRMEDWHWDGKAWRKDVHREHPPCMSIDRTSWEVTAGKSGRASSARWRIAILDYIYRASSVGRDEMFVIPLLRERARQEYIIKEAEG